MASGSVKLHPKYGINPTMNVCWWCGEQDGTVALLGAAYQGEAPPRMICGYEPCQKCQDNMQFGLTIIEATEHKRDEHQREMQKGAFPTGRWCVVKDDGKFIDLLDEPLRSKVRDQGVMFMDPAMYESLGLHEPKIEHPAEVPKGE